MQFKEHFKGFRFFVKAMRNTRTEMWVSLQVLAVLTLILSVLLYWVEHMAQPEVYNHLWDSIVWSFMAYLGNPGKFAPADPITMPGRLLWILISLLKIALFAVPAGLIANGFRAAMAEDEHNKRLESLKEQLTMSFRLKLARRINDYAGEKKYRLEPLMQSMVTLQTDYLMDTRDVIDVCKRYPEYRLVNLAKIQTEAENPQDRMVVLHSPNNRPYGCCIDRGSKVTIVCTSAWSELATEWFGRTMAELGGFNFISKNIEENPLEPHSYFNMSDSDSANQAAFYEDLKRLSTGEGHWNIYLLHVVTNSTKGGNHTHFNAAMKDGESPTIQDMPKYESLKAGMTEVLKDYGFDCTTVDSERFPLVEKNVAYRLQKDDVIPNSFSFRIGAHIMAKHPFKEVIAYRFAEQINAIATA